MYTLIRLTLAAALFGGAGYCLDWLHPVRLMIGLPVAAICGLVLAAITWTIRPRKEDVEEGLNPLRELLIALFVAAVWIGFTSVYLTVALRHPSLGNWLDSDRAHIEEVVERLEAAGNWGETIEFLDEQIAEPHSPVFTRWLVDRTLLNYVRAADANRKRADDFLQRACTLAEQHGLPTDYYQIQRKYLRESLKTSGVTSDYEKRLASERAASEAAAQSAKDREAKLTTAAKQQITHAQGKRLDAVATLMRQAANPQLVEIRTFAAAEISAVKPYGVPTANAEKLLQWLDAYIAGNSPGVFPRGTELRLRQVVPVPASKLLVADLLVKLPASATLRDIGHADWVITQHGKALKCVSSQSYRDGRRLAVAIIVDCSISAKGTPLASAVQGVQQLLGQLPDDTPIWLARFSDQTTPLVDWSTNKNQAIAACKQLQASGYTALYDSVSVAIDALAHRMGDELVLVIFSDGANTKPGPTPDDLIVGARQRGVRIHSIALQSGQVDEQVLRRLANETGGSSTITSHADQLGNHFRQLAEELSTPCLRLVALDYDPTQPCTIALGSGTDPVLTLPAAQGSQASSQSSDVQRGVR